MKTKLAALALVIYFAVAVVTGAEDKTRRPIELVSNLPEEIAVAALVSYFEPAVKKGERLEDLYLVNFPNAESVAKKVGEILKRTVVLKSGGSYRVERTAFVEDGTGRSCTLIKIKLLELEPAAATVTFEWHATQMAGAGSVYHLKKGRAAWSVARQVPGYAI